MLRRACALIFPLALFAACGFADQGRVESVSFNTTCEMPIATIASELEPLRRLVEAGAPHLPEGAMLTSAVALGQKQFLLAPEQVAQLTTALDRAYATIVADPAFKDVKTALTEAIAQDPARPGHYFLYHPPHVTPDSRTIVFLHGFGGNFLAYTWALKEAFPDDLIIAPSYGIAWQQSGAAYLDEVLADARRRLDSPLDRPWLFALSAGGPAGFAIYNATPDRFRGLVCIASAPSVDQVPNLKADLKVLMLSGTRDGYFPIDRVRAAIAPLRNRLPNARFEELDSDHFFLLTRRRETFDRIGEFIAQKNAGH